MILVKLDDLMWRYKVTAKELAEKTGLGTNTISRLRNNKAKGIDFNTLEKLCNFFKCSVSDIIGIK